MGQNLRLALSSLSLAMLSIVTGNAASAQTVLERLEQQIRQRNPPSNNAASSADSSPTPSSAKSNVALDGTAPRKPAYLGLVANDQNDRGRGVRVMTVHPGSPADKAGFRRQDLITAIAGIRVRQMSDVADILDTFSAGRSARFDILRDGQKQTVQVTFGSRGAETKSEPPQPPAANPQLGPPAFGVVQPIPTPSVDSAGSPEAIPVPPAEALSEPAEQSAGPVLFAPQEAAPGKKPAEQPAQTATQTLSESQRIDQLQRRIDELDRRVAELERALAEATKGH